MIINNVMMEDKVNCVYVYFDFKEEPFYLLIKEENGSYRSGGVGFYSIRTLKLFQELDQVKHHILGTLLNRELFETRSIFPIVDGKHDIIKKLEIDLSQKSLLYLLRKK